MEVGAGIGETTKVLCRKDSFESWNSLEPDEELVERIADKIRSGELPSFCEAVCGTLSGLPDNAEYDTILYIDVLEHIHDDRRELAEASRHLASGGHLVVVSPAHNWLYTPFDKAVGHYRRYNRQSLGAIGPGGTRCVSLHY